MYIGIDPSLTNTAIVVLECMNDVVTVIDTDLIHIPSGKLWRDQVHRVHGIYERIVNKFELAKDVCIVLEGYSYSSRFQSHQLGELGYVLRYWMSFYTAAYVVPPKTIIKFVTGKGNATKKDVAEHIKCTYGFSFPTLHHSDACAAALFGVGIAKGQVWRNLDTYRGKII